MRQDRTVQASLFDIFAKHEIGCELKKASAWLDGHPTLIGLVAADLRHDGVQETGRRGLPAEAVPAREKLVSLFETHADIIVKGKRDIQYGHKLNLSTGR